MSEVPVMRGNSQAMDEAAQFKDMLNQTPVEQSSHRSEIFPPSQINLKKDTPIKVAATRKLTVPNYLPECSFPPHMTNVQIEAQDAARPHRSGNEQPFESVRRETRNVSRRNPQVGAFGVGSGPRGNLSGSENDVHRNSVANHGYASSEVPVVRAFTRDEYEAAQALLMLSHATVEEDSRSAEIVSLSPSRMTTDTPIQVAARVKLFMVNQVAEISLPPRNIIDKRRARNPGRPPRSGGKQSNKGAPASTVWVRSPVRLQLLGGEEQSAVKQTDNPRFKPRPKTNYRHADEGEDRPFKCTVARCKSSFTSNGHLQQHIRTVYEGIRPFFCKKEVLKANEVGVMKWGPCDSGFASAYALKLVCFASCFSMAMTRMLRYSMRLRY